MGTIELNVVAKREPPKPPPDILTPSSAKMGDHWPPFIPGILVLEVGKQYVTRHGHYTKPLKMEGQRLLSNALVELEHNPLIVHGYYDTDGRYTGLGDKDKRHLIMEKVVGWEILYAWMCGQPIMFKLKNSGLNSGKYPTYKDLMAIKGSVSGALSYMKGHLKDFDFHVDVGDEW